VSVSCDNVPAKCCKLVNDRIWRHYVLYLSVDLKSVIIHNSNEVIKLIMSGKHCSLPYLTLFDLAVAKDSIHLIGIACELS
jgi:hypothetical protein